MPTYTIKNSNGDVLLANTMPEAEYMYGCTPTAMGMLLGYYDLYGYRETSLDNIIEGEVALKSRGTDGDAYDMDAFDTVLGKAIASEEYVYRFVSRDNEGFAWLGTETPPAQELEYTFKEEGKTLNTDVWNCIADYLGTGQFWRGNNNLSTTVTSGSLEELYKIEHYKTISDGSITKQVRYLYTSMLYGLDLYVQSRGYALDYEITGTFAADVCGGDFSFEDYMAEIDAGRPVLISIEAHSMVGYGYNEAAREIIFDDCYEANQRMVWDGTYDYADAERALQSITVVGINVNGSVDLAVTETSGSSGKMIVAVSTGAMTSTDYCFAGSNVYLTYTVSNLGEDKSGAFLVAVRVDDELVSSAEVESLEAGVSSKTADVSLGELSVGLHNVRVIIDEANDISELSGLNNTAESDILVLKSGTSVLSGTNVVDNGETVSDIFVYSGGELNLISGRALDTVLKGVITSSSSTGTVWFQRASANILQDGFMSATDICAYGEVTISGGGTAVNTRIFSSGAAYIFEDGIASDVSIGSSGKLTVYSGGELTGRIRIDNGAFVMLHEGSILDFDLSAVSPGQEPIVNDLSRFNGIPVYTITITDSQEKGIYTLAGGAADFNLTISVFDTDGIEVETVSVGESFYVGQNKYTLSLSGSALTFTISEKLPPDTIAPSVTNVKASPTLTTNQDVTITAEFSDNQEVASKLYRIGEKGDWISYTDGVLVSSNTTVYFKAIDASGNESEVIRYTVDNIDKTAPVKPTVSADITSSTSGEVTVTAAFSEDSVKKEYSLDGKEWFAYTAAIVFQGNGTVYFRGTDAAGNISDVTRYNVTNIEKDVLTRPVASANITSPTNGNVIVTAVFSENTVRKEYSLDGINWKSYKKGVKFFDNGLVYFRGTDASGTFSDVTSYAVTNILSEIEDYNSGFKITSTNGAGRGTLFKDTTVDSGGSLYVASGGICVDTTVNDGYLAVSSNGIANGIVVNSGGYLHVSSGGTALNIIENGGHVYVDDDAEVSFCANHLSSVFVTGWGKFSIDSGTTAVDLVLSLDVYLHISRGGVVQNARIDHCGEIIISSGGTASNSILVDYMGNITILSGGVADGCKINNLGGGGRLFLSSGGTAQYIVASRGAKLNIAVASDTYLQGTYDGSAFEMKDAFISDYTVQSSGGIIVFSGASADSINVSSGGSIVISSGGTATNVVASACAQLGIDVASGTYVQGVYAGSSFEMKNAFISDYTVQSGGRITVYSGGTAANTTVVNGDLYVSSGGTATNVVWTPCAGSVEFEEGAYVTFASQYSNVYYGSNNELLSHTRIMESLTLSWNAPMHVMSGGTANGTVVQNTAQLDIWSGGTANNTIISSGGTMNVRSDGETNSATISGTGYDYNNIRYSSLLKVFSGGTAHDTIVHEDGWLYVSSNGLANRTTVNSNGRMDVSGGTANSAVINSGGSINVFSDGMANAVSVNAYGWLFASSGGIVNNAAVNIDGRMTVSRGGEAVNTIVSSGGIMSVLSGGTATNIVASSGAYLKLTVAPDTYIQGTMDGRLFKLENASISDYTLDSNIEFDIASGAIVNSITVAKDGCLYVSSGGTATNITAVKGAGLWLDVAPETYIKGTYNGNGFEMKNAFLSGYTVSNNGAIYISSGGTVSNTTVNKYGSVEVIGGVANKTTLNADGWLQVCSGGIANHVKVNSWGGLFVSSGGTANSVTLEKGGEMDIECGGTVNNLVVNGNSWLIDFHQDAKLTGKVTFANGVSVWMADESILDFDITQTSAGAAARVNNLSCIDGNPIYTLTVTDSQMAGTYKLAKGASKFKKSIFVRNTSDEVIGKLRIGNTELINGQNYTLTCSNGCLSLTVEASDNPMIVMADITEMTNRDVTLTVEIAEDMDCEAILYRVGGGNDWKTYDDGVTVADNTTVYFKYIDTDGNESAITGYDVKNIDKTPPTRPVVSVDMTRPTRHSVICSVEFSEDSAIREYSLDGITWFVCSDTVRLTENGTAYFRGTDAAGNVSDASNCTVTNIDNTLRDDGSDDGWNDYLYNKKAVFKLNLRTEEFERNELDENVSEILLDTKDSVNVDGKHNFVGKYNEESADEFDFAKISLSKAAKLIFKIDTTDAVKFVVYSLVEGTGRKAGTYTMKALQTSLFNNPGKGYTKGLLLSSGEYYISMQSTNVRKGGTAFYNVELDKNSVF